LTRIFEPKRNAVIGDWRKFQKDIIGAIKSRMMRWAGQVTLKGRRRMYEGFWWESRKERGH
jgi:hypothetical protein